MFNMGAVKAFDVFLDDELEVYHIGESMKGRVVVSLTKDLAMKGIRVSLKGEIRTQWREKIRSATGQKRAGTCLRGAEQFMFDRATVWGKELDSDDDSEIPLLQAGSHSFPFQFHLPTQPNLACSFECDRIACIRYFVQANMDISWAVDPVAERYFSFIGSPINCNLPKFLKVVHATDRKTIRCCCRSSGPIALKAEMQRSAYCPGEFVNIRTRLDNNSANTMKLGVRFVQNISLVAENPKRRTKTGSYEILCYTSPAVLPDQEYILETARMLQIPIVPYTIASRLIQVAYLIEVFLMVDDKQALEIYFPITVGNVPYKDSSNRPKQISYGHACPQSCGSNTGYMQYNDGDRIMQVKQFTPLYLTACAVIVQDYPTTNGAIPGNHPSTTAQSNGYLPGGSGRANGAPRNQLSAQPSVNSLLQYGHSRSSLSLHNGSGTHQQLDDPSVIASKSSGSITKYITTSTNNLPLSRKPSSSDTNPIYQISGQERFTPIGIDLNSNANCTASEGTTTAEDQELAEVMARHQTDYYAVEYGEGGRVYACHYV
ncbi:arrestin domain-containing protein 3-like [Patiria miniata]|uniref:Arrestin C-terminal-like domain-containing protein n=1 Tax=Patiria miniata TaxID=46514 RepID=A0A914AW52_PATMI|nr:arrestin domain-containing protein 3-like [Patiria miniata]